MALEYRYWLSGTSLDMWIIYIIDGCYLGSLEISCLYCSYWREASYPAIRILSLIACSLPALPESPSISNGIAIDPSVEIQHAPHPFTPPTTSKARRPPIISMQVFWACRLCVYGAHGTASMNEPLCCRTGVRVLGWGGDGYWGVCWHVWGFVSWMWGIVVAVFVCVWCFRA